MYSTCQKIFEILRTLLELSRRSYIVYITMIGLALLALISLGRSVHYNFFTPAGGIDFHSYWYSGLFVLQGTDPYEAHRLKLEPETPVAFLDGPVADELPRGGVLAATPANTAPMVLLLTPFSLLSWPTARSLWFFINFILAIFLPLLAIRLLLPPLRLPWAVLITVLLAFYALKSTRSPGWRTNYPDRCNLDVIVAGDLAEVMAPGWTISGFCLVKVFCSSPSAHLFYL